MLKTQQGVPTTISNYQLEPEADKELWKLYTDGTSSKEGSDAGLNVQNPKGEEITYSIQQRGKVKALLASLRLAKEVGAKQLASLIDSLLITNHVNGTYEAKDLRLQKYLDAV
uniref:RNase H type-1 domain-containing protein n=1 Tax=Lactuca sativa TaxID=4236 RepID=A0A9R1W3G6_LACSA|nr:hypothetical protein LSAT_V11C300104620 [Lactuca sativa]